MASASRSWSQVTAGEIIARLRLRAGFELRRAHQDAAGRSVEALLRVREGIFRRVGAQLNGEGAVEHHVGEVIPCAAEGDPKAIGILVAVPLTL